MLVLLALVFAALEIGANLLGPYELFHDELYYWACSRRFELGYVDHPPLAPWLLAATRTVLGDGRLAFALPPALCGAATVLLTGGMARRLGAGRFGQLLASLCVAAAPVFLALSSFYSVNAIELLLWTAASLLLVERIRSGDPHLWLAIGVVFGLGLLDKHTIALLGLGFAIAVVATPIRDDLRSRWPWLGAGLALLVAAPNLAWNAANDWPSLAFYRSRDLANLPTSLADAVEIQILAINPLALLVWLPGLAWLLFAPSGRRYRPLGIAFLVLFAVMLFSGQRRGDRIAGIYPVVLAAGAAFWGAFEGRGRSLVRVALPLLVAIGGLLALPATLPLLPPKTVAAYFDALGGIPEVEASDVGSEIPLYLTGRLGRERIANEVIAAVATLTAEERARAVVLTSHWVLASVIEYYGRNAALPPVVAPHNAYLFWRNDARGRDVAIALAVDPGVLSAHFAETTPLRGVRCDHCGPLPSDLTIYRARGPLRPLPELLAQWRHFGLEFAPTLLPSSGHVRKRAGSP